MVYFGDIKELAVGATAGDCETITTLKYMNWKREPDTNITPQTVMNTAIPVGFYHGHKWVIGEIGVLSEAYDAFYHNGTGNVAYVREDSINVTIPYVKAKVVDNAAATWEATFDTFFVTGISQEYRDGEAEPIQVYKFIAKWVKFVKT